MDMFGPPDALGAFPKSPGREKALGTKNRRRAHGVFFRRRDAIFPVIRVDAESIPEDGLYLDSNGISDYIEAS